MIHKNGRNTECLLYTFYDSAHTERFRRVMACSNEVQTVLLSIVVGSLFGLSRHEGIETIL